MELILTLGLMIVGASFTALLARKLKQPMILGYVVAGALLGPSVTGLISDPEPIKLLSELGLIFLMFIIGLELDLSKLKDVGSISLLLGVLQVAVTTAIAAFAANVVGFALIPSIYLGLVIALSSTLIVVKVLVDRRELSTTHGELTLGILIVQDVLAVLGLTLLGTLKSTTPLPGGLPTLENVLSWLSISLPATGIGTLLHILLAGAAFGALAFLFFRLIVPRVSSSVHDSSELFFVATLATIFLVALLAGFFGFSLAIGAFVAGVALSSSLHSHDIIGRVKPLRDFFLVLFFVSLGLQVSFKDLLGQFWLVLFLLAGALLLKPLITFLIVRLAQYGNRTSFLTSTHLAQVGEFSLILVSAGVLNGTLPESVLTATVIATVLTMTLTAYVMKYDGKLYELARPFLQPFAFFGKRKEPLRSLPKAFAPTTIVIGVNRRTAALIESFLKQKRRVLLVDHREEPLAGFKERGVPVFCADPSSDELYEHVDCSKVELVVSVLAADEILPLGPDANEHLIKRVRERSPNALFVFSATHDENARSLYEAGATLVLVPDVLERKALEKALGEQGLEHVRELGKLYERELKRKFHYLKEE